MSCGRNVYDLVGFLALFRTREPRVRNAEMPLFALSSLSPLSVLRRTCRVRVTRTPSPYLSISPSLKRTHEKIRTEFRNPVKCEQIARKVYARNILRRRRSSSMPGYLRSRAGAAKLTSTEIHISARYIGELEIA